MTSAGDQAREDSEVFDEDDRPVDETDLEEIEAEERRLDTLLGLRPPEENQ